MLTEGGDVVNQMVTFDYEGDIDYRVSKLFLQPDDSGWEDHRRSSWFSSPCATSSSLSTCLLRCLLAGLRQWTALSIKCFLLSSRILDPTRHFMLIWHERTLSSFLSKQLFLPLPSYSGLVYCVISLEGYFSMYDWSQQTLEIIFSKDILRSGWP